MIVRPAVLHLVLHPEQHALKLVTRQLAINDSGYAAHGRALARASYQLSVIGYVRNRNSEEISTEAEPRAGYQLSVIGNYARGLRRHFGTAC